MNEKIANTIALRQQIINELNVLKEKVNSSASENIRFRIETKHWYGYGPDIHYGKERDIVDLSKDAMMSILNEAIYKERERINKLIDMEIDQKIKKEVITNEKKECKSKTRKSKNKTRKRRTNTILE